MKLIVGLGNPGSAYVSTRHNIGRRLIEFIAAEEKVKLLSKKSQKAAMAAVSWNEEAIHLAHPMTYMNLSGGAIAALVKYLKIAITSDLLIVVDDVALPFGKLRLRGEGSPGGHHGLASIEAYLGSREYPRLRIGIGPQKNEEALGTSTPDGWLRDYVLSAFSASEEKAMRRVLKKGTEACRIWAAEPLAKAMNHINTVKS